MPLDITTQAHLLVSFEPDEVLRIDQEVLQAIAQVKRVKVCVLCITGYYRTGKSTLLNWISRGERGFAVGDTVQTCTRGIWVKGIQTANKFILLLDSEGLGNPQQPNTQQDIRMFSLCILLASLIVYNSVGQINEPAIQLLQMVSSLAEHINAGGEEEMDKHLPHFLWVVRDFGLELIDAKNKPISADQYLENALQPKFGYSQKIMQYNSVRNALRNYFRNRGCIVVPAPNNLAAVEPGRSPDAAFQLAMEDAVNVIVDRVPPKVVNGVELTGNMWADLVTLYVGMINDGAVPSIDDAFTQLQKIEGNRLLQDALDVYGQQMQTQIQEKSGFPLEVQQLENLHGAALGAAMKLLSESKIVSKNMLQALTDSVVVYDSENRVIGGLYFQFQEQNNAASSQMCQQLLATLHIPISEKIRAVKYSKPLGSYEDYVKDKQELITTYKQSAKGPLAGEILEKFLAAQMSVDAQILGLNTQLDEVEKKIAEDKERVRIEQLHAENVENKNKELKANVIAQKQMFAEQIQALQTQYDTALKTFSAQQEDIIVQRLKEQENLLRTGFQQEAVLMRQAVDDLKAQQVEMQKHYKEGMERFQELMKSQNEMIVQLANRPPEKVIHTTHEEPDFFDKLLDSIVPVVPQLIGNFFSDSGKKNAERK